MQEFFKPDRLVFIDWIHHQWGIKFHGLCEDAIIQGSPERTVSRAVFKDIHGRRFLIESFSRKKYQRRLTVANVLACLVRNGLDQAVAYKKSTEGSFLPFFKEQCYQVSQFLDSTGVKQPDYLSSGTMGESFALFLTRMAAASGPIDQVLECRPFSIKTYIYDLFARMRIHDTRVYDDFSPILAFLEKSFMPVHDQLPVSFCHGDLHPLNVIWAHDTVRAVIDWEFTGIKPDIYDVANLTGCAGIENPDGLGMPMVMQFIKTLQANHLFSEQGWHYLPEYMLALRFAWLSEWLRKKDHEMIAMEKAYMNILMNNTDILRMGWNI